MDMSEIQPLGENSVLVGSAKPPEQTPVVPIPASEKPVEVAPATTPQEVVAEVVQATTKQQIGELLHEFADLAKDYYTKIGKAMGGVVVHEGVKTLQGAREIKLKNAARPDEVLFTEEIHTDAKGHVTYQSKTDAKQGTVESTTTNVRDILNDKGKRIGRIITRQGTSGAVINSQVESGVPKKGFIDYSKDAYESGVPKKGFIDNAKEAYKAGNKYALGQEAKNKQAEGAINVVGAIVTDTVLQPYPDIPRFVTGITDAVSSYIPNKGIEFIPAVLQILKADLDVVKSGVDLAKRFKDIIRKSPETQGSKGDTQATFKVVQNLIKEQIDTMKKPKAIEAARVFAAA